MLFKVSGKITDRLVLKNVIKKEDWEIYQYGMYQLILNIVDIGTILMLGIVFNEIWQAFVIMGAFASMRAYAGGYHATTPLRCYLLTTIITVITLLVIKYAKIEYFVWIVLLFVSSVVILMLSPVESENKPLDIMEKKIYKKNTYIIWGVETGVAVLFAFFKAKSVFVCITMAEVVLSLALIYEIIKKQKEKSVNEERIY